VVIQWVNAEKLESEPDLGSRFREVNGIVVPGGFGYRGIEGKIRAFDMPEKSIPYFGLCLGLQTAVIEFARNVCGFGGGTQHRI